MATNKHKGKANKTMCNNQWASTNCIGCSKNYHDKTATSNEWVSTNKLAELEDQI